MTTRSVEELFAALPKGTTLKWDGELFCAKVPCGRAIHAFGKTVIEALTELEKKLEGYRL